VASILAPNRLSGPCVAGFAPDLPLNVTADFTLLRTVLPVQVNITVCQVAASNRSPVALIVGELDIPCKDTHPLSYATTLLLVLY
jgi:hypothetical protein